MSDRSATDPATGPEPGADPGGSPGTDPAAKPVTDAEGPPDGLVTVRGAIFGVAMLWLAAMAAFGAVQAAVYGATTAPVYLLVALVAVPLAVTAGYASLRSFGLR